MITKTFELTIDQRATIIVALQSQAHKALEHIRWSTDEGDRAYWKQEHANITALVKILYQ